MAIRDVGPLPTDEPGAVTFDGSPDKGSSEEVARADHGHVIEGDPLVQGLTAHDADASSTNPVLTGGYAKDGAAPTSVSADGDAVRAWYRRNGAAVVEVIGSASHPVTNAGTFAVQATEADGANVALGATADADTASTVIGRLKKLVALVAGGLPAALGAGGGLKVDGSGTALPVTAAQATAASLNATVVGTGTFAVQAAATLSAETTKVIGTVRALGNAGAIVDGVVTAATSPANMVMGGGIYNSTEPSPTTGQSTGIQLDSKGRQRMVLMDAAANTRGANVDANNNLGVVLPAETTKVIGTIRNVGNAGGVFDGVITAATAPANMVVGGGVYNSTEPSPTTGQSTAVQLDAKGRTRTVVMDAAGNTRGQNVDASNRALVDNASWIGSTAPTVGSKTSANSVPVVVASDQGAVLVNPGLAPGSLLNKGVKYTTTQTSADFIAGTGGQRIYVSHLSIATGGTTAGRVSIYWGTSTFTSGTSITLFDGEFAPSSTSKPGTVLSFPIPVGGASATGDNLRVTTDAGITVYVTAQYWKA